MNDNGNQKIIDEYDKVFRTFMKHDQLKQKFDELIEIPNGTLVGLLGKTNNLFVSHLSDISKDLCMIKVQILEMRLQISTLQNTYKFNFEEEVVEEEEEDFENPNLDNKKKPFKKRKIINIQ